MYLIKNYPPMPLQKIKYKYHLATYKLQTYTINKIKVNNNQSKQKENKNNYMHNIIKAQQIKLL